MYICFNEFCLPHYEVVRKVSKIILIQQIYPMVKLHMTSGERRWIISLTPTNTKS